MPRRNRRKGRRPQAQRSARTAVPYDLNKIQIRSDGLVQRPKRRKLLPMVAAMGACSTGKIRYGTAADAEEALRRALINREILQSPVVEERWYPQPGDAPCICQGYHLTSAPRRAR